MSPPLRLVLVDDHAIVREGLRALLSAFDDLDVVGEAASGEEALTVLAHTPADVVLMDLEMPGMGGLAATRAILARDPGVAVLVLTMYGDDEFVLSAVRAGAKGYLLKGAQKEDVLRTIRGVSRGDAIFGGEVAGRLLGLLGSGARDTPLFPELTTREREVLALLADGLSNGSIGRRLGLSPRTVANHVSAVLAKLGAADRTDATIRARHAGLGTR